MKKPDQISPNFLYDLHNIRLFIELSDRHWKEESEKYINSNLDSDEKIRWDRYSYRNDLSAHFDTTFPQYQKQSYLVMLISLFEDYINQLCHSLHFEKKLCCKLQEYNGSGIERAKEYLRNIAHVEVPTGQEFWQRIMEARNIRNIIAHNAGHIDEQIHKNQLVIISKNANLDYENFARMNINIKQDYLFEVIEAMENFAKKMSIN